jgi:hypothetical protein
MSDEALKRIAGNSILRIPADKRLSFINGQGGEVAWINSLGEASFIGTLEVEGGVIEGALSVDPPTFVVDAVNHRVGIGTATPAAKLHVEGSVALPAIISESEPTPVAGMLWVDPLAESVGNYLPLAGGHLTGNITLDEGVTIDGVDLSELALTGDYLPLTGGTISGTLDVTGAITSPGITAPSEGTVIGGGATQKLGFWGAAPIVQPAGAGQKAPAAYATGAYGLNSNANMQALYDLVVSMRSALVSAGIMKGAAVSDTGGALWFDHAEQSGLISIL